MTEKMVYCYQIIAMFPIGGWLSVVCLRAAATLQPARESTVIRPCDIVHDKIMAAGIIVSGKLLDILQETEKFSTRI